MIKKENKPIKGEEKEFKLTDTRGVRYDPFTLPTDYKMMNPVAWELSNEWEDGFYLKDDLFKGMGEQTLIRVENNEIIEAFRLQPLEKDKDIL
jgi:hypothetical protein